MAQYTYWAKLTDPTGEYHLLRLHPAKLAARASELIAAWDTETRGDVDGGVALADATSEALAKARAELDWPDDWKDQPGYLQELASEPLHPTLVENAVQKHWVRAMPKLG